MTVEKIFDSKGKTREEWLQARKQGIGGSESATLLGLNPWSSTLDLYSDTNNAYVFTNYNIGLKGDI